MNTERRGANGETHQSNNESLPLLANEDKELISTTPRLPVPDIALSSVDTPAPGPEVDGLQTSNLSDTEGRDVLLENRDHDLRGLNGVVLDNGDQRTDHTVRPHLRAPIRITPPPTDQIAPSGGSIRSFGQISNQAGSGRQSGIYINPAALAPDGSSHDPTTSGPNSLTSGPEDGSPPGTRVRRRRRFMRWFRDHLSRQAPWSPFSRHDPLRVRRAIREFDRMFHR